MVKIKWENKFVNNIRWKVRSLSKKKECKISMTCRAGPKYFLGLGRKSILELFSFTIYNLYTNFAFLTWGPGRRLFLPILRSGPDDILKWKIVLIKVVDQRRKHWFLQSWIYVHFYESETSCMILWIAYGLEFGNHWNLNDAYIISQISS